MTLCRTSSKTVHPCVPLTGQTSAWRSPVFRVSGVGLTGKTGKSGKSGRFVTLLTALVVGAVGINGLRCATLLAQDSEAQPQSAQTAAAPTTAEGVVATGAPASPAPGSSSGVAVMRAEEAAPQPSVRPQAPAMKAPLPLRATRNVVVAPFAAPASSQARAGVLRALANHGDVEVVSMDDVSFAAMRLQADPGTFAGRAKLSRELGIDTWLDGQVEGNTAHLALTSGDGSLIQEVSVEADDPQQLDDLTGERMWAALGPRLSPQEQLRRELLGQYELARAKVEARAVELNRLTGLAQQARARRAAILRAQFALAQRKRAAFQAEVSRQTQLAQSRLPAAQPTGQAAATAVASKAKPKAKKRHKSRAARRAAAKRARHRRSVASASLTNTSDMKAKKKAKKSRRRSRRSAADSGKVRPDERELLSRQ